MTIGKNSLMNGSYTVAASSKGHGVRDGPTETVLVVFPMQTRKRGSTSSGRSLRRGDGNGSRRGKLRKVSRACDFCKARKARCSGDRPCAKCVDKGRECLYDARYTRGRPPTPPQSEARSRVGLRGLDRREDEGLEVVDGETADDGYNEVHAVHEEPAISRRPHESTAPSRASPELGMEEIQGQVFDPTSDLTFLHRAWKRLSSHNSGTTGHVPTSSAETQSLTMAGDRPLPEVGESAPIPLPNLEEAENLLSLYFDVCIATYRILHRPAVEAWLGMMEKNVREQRPIWHEVGRARAAIVLVALAIATLHRKKSKGSSSPGDSSQTLRTSDELFCISTRLADQETGYPRIESVQVRIIHVLYLLTTARLNRAWYVFGTALQLIAALGLHRRARRASQTDYVSRQCSVRTFWTAYILDNYLGIIFGRPRHFHDDDIDQVFPDRVNEEMTAVGENPDCHIDALIFHAKYEANPISSTPANQSTESRESSDASPEKSTPSAT